MQDQLRQLCDVSDRVKGVSSEIGEDGNRKEGTKSSKALDKRLQAAKDRQDQLVQRYETLRNKVLKSGGRPLSEMEKSWVSEVQAVSTSLESKQKDEGTGKNLTQRLEAVRLLYFFSWTTKELTICTGQGNCGRSGQRSEAVRSQIPSPSGTGQSIITICVSAKGSQRLQRARIGEAMRMVEREYVFPTFSLSVISTLTYS